MCPAVPPPATTTDAVIAPIPRGAAGRGWWPAGPGTAAAAAAAAAGRAVPCPCWRSAATASGSCRAALASMPKTNMVTTSEVPPGGDQRQLQPGHRQQPDDVADVDGGLGHQPGGGGGDDQLEPRVGVAAPRSGYRCRPAWRTARAPRTAPRKPELLADDREDEVVVRVGQIAPLGPALPEPDAEQPAVGQRVQRLLGLEAGLERVDALRGEERGDPGQPVVGAQRQRDGPGRRRRR